MATANPTCRQTGVRGISPQIDLLYQRHVEALDDSPVSERSLAALNGCLRDLERFWDAEVRYRNR